MTPSSSRFVSDWSVGEENHNDGELAAGRGPHTS
jgi:hypothetical protein